ncbi:MAG: carbohydrate-binding family 25 protein [Acetivibrionales bacterium]|jgi:hypothetical protein
MSIFDNMMMNNSKNQKQSSMKKSSKNGTDSFTEEYSDDLAGDVSRYGIQSYSKSGVSFEKLSEAQGEVSYSGLLAKSGAQEVYGVYGFGSNQNWEAVSTLQFKKEGENLFRAIIPIEQGKNVNIAFKDSAENWDNNSGMNYTFVN